MPQIQRKLRRRHLIYYLRVFERDTGELLGHLVDLTPEGVLLMGERALEPGTSLTMTMDLPTEICGKPKLQFVGHCVWSRQDPNTGLHDSGFRLDDLPLPELNVMGVLIDDYGFRD